MRLPLSLTLGLAMVLGALPVRAADFSEAWRKTDNAIIVDAYEYNPIDWQALATDKRIVGFINKGSDGLPPDYHCKGDEDEQKLCSVVWKRYSVAKELFHTRKAMAKSLGLEWGAYHLGRPGNPIDQANHFIDFADPGPDDLIALDIEDNDPEAWMSLEDAEEFARHIKRRLGRYPVLYTNGSTAQYIADNRDKYELLSRLPLWYARYKPEIGEHFPKGNWESYALWQFSAQANCNEKSCPYRVPGTQNDIDVNVAAQPPEELRKAWPFGGLVDPSVELMASVPVPTPRAEALAAKAPVELSYAQVAQPAPLAAINKAFGKAGVTPDVEPYVPAGKAEIETPTRKAKAEATAAGGEEIASNGPQVGLAEYLAELKDSAGPYGFPLVPTAGEPGQDASARFLPLKPLRGHPVAAPR